MTKDTLQKRLDTRKISTMKSISVAFRKCKLKTQLTTITHLLSREKKTHKTTLTIQYVCKQGSRVSRMPAQCQ